MDEVASEVQGMKLKKKYREVKGILLYQGFPRPILSQKIWSTALNVL